MIFFLWGHLKAMVYAEEIRTLVNLKRCIVECCASITPDILSSVNQASATMYSMRSRKYDVAGAASLSPSLDASTDSAY